MLIILYKSRSLFKIFSSKVIFKTIDLLHNDWNAIFANNDTLHFDTANFIVPIVVPYICNLKPFVRISLKYLLD